MKTEPQSPWSRGTGTTIGTGAGTGPDRGPASMATVVLPQPKQIRFVNNEGRPPAKRRRVDSACQTCRRRKIRCDGAKPQCKTCTDNRHECGGYPVLPANISGSSTKSPEVKQRQGSGDGIKNEEDEEKSGNLIPTLTSPFNQGDVKPQLSGTNSTRRSTGSSPNDDESRDRDSKYSDDDWDAAQSSTRVYRVPYFRWFGPTAIIKGFKQMVVEVGEPRRKGPTSISSASPHSITQSDEGGYKHPGIRRPSVSMENRPELPAYEYDGDEDVPVPWLITDLVELFFQHLGCSFPFLRREKVLAMVRERRMEPILVNAICALAARFSQSSLLTSGRSPKHIQPAPQSANGKVYAQRAQGMVTNTFVKPSPEFAQAMLLLAYEAFGADQDSALWHYEGLAIRMVVDLGLLNTEGLRLPRGIEHDHTEQSHMQPEVEAIVEEQTAAEQELSDTLWAIFSLDRYISSGLGRPVTMPKDHFEVSPPDTERKTPKGLPAPLPSLINIIVLCGELSDVLNKVKSANAVTPQHVKKISELEGQMIRFHGQLPDDLKFSIEHFQTYMNHGEGTNFIMLHLWFHMMVMLVNCPALLSRDENEPVLPNSKIDMALVSAKTVADLASAAQFHGPDQNVIAGNPFTSQPLYIAAAAFLFFLKPESQNKTSIPSSREESPEKKTMRKPSVEQHSSGLAKAEDERKKNDRRAAEKGYNQCYTALKNLERYWAGTKYILTALDQRARGIADPEAFTAEEMESTKRKPPPGMRTGDWTRKLAMMPSPSMRSSVASLSPQTTLSNSPPPAEASKTAQKRLWAMTGTTNSPNSLATFFMPPQNEAASPAMAPSPAPSNTSASSTFYDPVRATLPEATRPQPATANYSRFNATGYHATPHQPMRMNGPYSNHAPYGDNNTQDHAALLLDLRNSPHPHNRGVRSPYNSNGVTQQGASPPAQFPYDQNHYSYGQMNGPFAQQVQQQNWGMHTDYHDGTGAGNAQYQVMEMDIANMPSVLQNMDETNFGLDFLPTEWTQEGMTDGWGHYGVMEDDSGGM